MNHPLDKNQQTDDRGSAPASKDEPAFESVLNHLLYGLSLPERALRSTTALVGGAVRESAALLVPQAFRTSKSYSLFVEQMLDLMCHKVGGVATKETKPSPTQLNDYVARKAVSNFIDLAGLATLHLSPMAVLAIVSDVAYGSQVYLKQLSVELKKEGVIAENTTIDHAADLLQAIGHASAQSAEVFDMPPLSVDGLKQTIEQTRSAVEGIRPDKLLPQREIERLWQEMVEASDREQVSLFEMSSAMALFTVSRVGDVGRGTMSSVRIAGSMFDQHIFEHYRDALGRISETGFYATLAESSKPYVDAVWQNFSRTRPTITEDVVTGKFFGRIWNGMRHWMKTKEEGEG